jgi:hypothetical protein
MKLLKVFPKGSTVEVDNSPSYPEYRSCSSTGSVCKYSRDIYSAINFAQMFEDYHTQSR